jgi:hypothetical protein
VGEEGICYPTNAEELVEAVTTLPCPVVILNAPVNPKETPQVRPPATVK